MNIDDIKNLIQNEINNNSFSMIDINKKIRIIEENLIDTKINGSIIGAVVPYLFLINSVPFLCSSEVIPAGLICPFILSSSLAIGFCLEEFFTFKVRWREKLKEFSNASNQRELMKESARYKIEFNKLAEYNSILYKFFKEFDSSNTKNGFKNNNFSDKRMSKEQIRKKIGELKTSLKLKSKSIDVVATKFFLRNEYNKIKDKINDYDDEIFFGIICGLIIVAVYNFPILLHGSLLGINFSNTIANMLISFFIGSAIGTYHSIKKKNDYLSAIKSLNNDIINDKNLKDCSTEESINKRMKNILHDLLKTKLEIDVEEKKLVNSNSDKYSFNFEDDDIKIFDDALRQLEENGFFKSSGINKRVLKRRYRNK